MRIKVLYIITKAEIGGAQKYVQDLANNLNQKLFEPKILYGGQNLKWLSNAVNPWQFFINDWLAIKELIHTYKKEQPDIIHLNSSKAGVLGTLATFFYNLKNVPKIKIIFTAHGWVFNPTNSIAAPIRWFYIFLHKITGLFQSRIICVSEYDYKLAKQYFIAPSTKLVAIHNGINLNTKFFDSKKAQEILRKKLNSKLNPEYSWIGSIGRLVKEKNYETLIQTAILVPNSYFFIVGSGPELKNYQNLIAKLNLKNRFFIIQPTGLDSQYLKALNIFVMTSIKEGLPYILLEAMLAELPIVVTEAGGIPEMIQNHENGFMIAPKKPNLLAQAINGLLANPDIAKNLKEKAKKSVQEKFSLEKMVSKTEKIYKEVACNSLSSSFIN